MAPVLKQQSTTAELKTPLGKDELVITRFDGSEGLSELFTYNIEALSETEHVDFDPALGARCTVPSKPSDRQVHEFAAKGRRRRCTRQRTWPYGWRSVTV